MTNIVTKIKRDLKRDKIIPRYTHKGRYINHEVYQELKKIQKCQMKECKSSKQLEIHHKIPVSKGGSNEKSNLIVLCHKCHRKQH